MPFSKPINYFTKFAYFCIRTDFFSRITAAVSLLFSVVIVEVERRLSAVLKVKCQKGCNYLSWVKLVVVEDISSF